MKQNIPVETQNFAQNIVDTVREPLLILSADLYVHSANRAFYEVFGVSPEETEGRLIYELGNGQWDIPALRTLLEDIIPQRSVLNDFELEHAFPVIGRRVILLNARQLREGNHTEYLVLAMEDVTERRRAERLLADIETYAQNIVDTVREPLLMLDSTLRVRSANRAFYQTFLVSPEETEGHLIYELGNGQWDIPALRTLLEDIIPQRSVFNDYELEHDFPTIGRRVILLNARQLRAGNHTEMLVLAMEDVTERRRIHNVEIRFTEELQDSYRRLQELEVRNFTERKRYEERLERAVAETNHRVKNSLQVACALVEMHTLVHKDAVPVAKVKRVTNHLKAMASIQDLLTNEVKIDAGTTHLSAKAMLEKLLPFVQRAVGEKQITYQADELRLPVKLINSLAILVNELIANAVKHGQGAIHLRMMVEAGGQEARLEVNDDGPGFPEGFDSHHAANTGLELVEGVSRYDLQGRVYYENRPGGGGRVVVVFPIPKE